jgi:hypothetical protein
MKVTLRLLAIFCCILGFVNQVQAQSNDEWSSALDSARAKEDAKQDSVILSAKYIRYTTLDMMKKGTYTVQIDTSHRNFQYYNKQNLPWNPSINLGSYGLATRDLLFQPTKTIGFQSGFHSLERTLYRPDSIQYFRARARFSELYAVGFFFDDQVFRARIAQNINPRLNIGGEFHATKTDGYYTNQKYSDIKSALFAWYESENHRYNLLTNLVFNKLDATENGSVLSNSIFKDSIKQSSDRYPVRLQGLGDNRPRNEWRDNSFFIRQSMFIGHLDTVDAGKPTMQIFPTNSIAHNSSVRIQKFNFFKNETDANGAFPYGSSKLTQDTTEIKSISNEFEYSFYLRGKSIFKNEAKLNVAFQHDMYWYSDSGINNRFYQNGMLKGELGYKFSDRVNMTGKVNQIVMGHNFGDYLYEAKADFLLSSKVGKITLSAYSQNKSPDMVFTRMNYTYHQWERDLEKTKTQNLAFQYSNPKIGFNGKVEYFLMDNYLYFKEIDNPQGNPRLSKLIEPAQLNSANLLKVSVGQKFKFRKFTLDNLIVYQKTDQQKVLATPEIYTWHSLYYSDVLYKVVDFDIGLDARFNTPFTTPSYSINASQFYNDNAGIQFSTYPIFDVWATANIQRVTLFISCNFVNQYLGMPKGYYTVRRYPMNDANIRFGVSWKFYD